MSEALHLLIIDDEDAIRESLRAFLEDYDYQVDAVDSTEAALEGLQPGLYRLAVVDMRLPGESGDAFILKAHAIDPDLRFLIHTGSVDFELTQDLCSVGILPCHVFVKPLPDLSLLANAIQERLDAPG